MAIKIRIVSEFDKRGINQAEQQLGSLAKAAGVALAAVGAAMATVAVKSVQEFSKFDAALTQSKAIMGDLSETMEKDMARAAREVAKATTFTAEEAGQSFFYLASAGLDAAASIEALPRVAQFAQAGMFDMSRATDLLTDAQSALGLTIRDDAIANMENMVKVSDVLVRANTLSNATVEQFSTSLTTKAGPALRTLGKDMEEGVAVLAAFADQGIKGEEAGTQLSIVLRDLSTKAIKNRDEFDKLGVAVFDSRGEMNNLGDIIGNLENVLAGMSDETAKATLLQLGFADRSVQSILALLGTSEAIKDYEKNLRSASGFTDEVANKQLDTFNSQLKLLESAFVDVGIQIGEILTPYLRDLIPVLQELLPQIGDKLAEAIKKVDWAGLIQSVADFVVAVVDNIDQIVAFVKGLGVAAAAIIAFYAQVKIAKFVTDGFTIALQRNPLIAFATALGVVAFSLAEYADEVYGSKVNTEGMTDAQAENARKLEGLRKLQDQYRYALENGNEAARQLAEDGLRRVRDEMFRVEYATQTTAGEINRFNNLRLDSIIAQANRARAAFANMTFTGTGGTQSWLDEMFGTGPSTVFEPDTGGGGGGKSARQLAFEEAQRLIKDSQKQLAEAQKEYNKSIMDANERYTVNVERLQKEFAARLEGIIQTSQNRLRDAYRSAVEVNLSSLFARDEDKSVEGLVKSLSDKLTASRTLLANSAALASQGFSQTFIEQVVSAGTETGNELASAILNSTPDVQRELQALFGAIEIESNQGMDALAESIYERQGLATQALKDLYATTTMEQAEAMLEQQAILDAALIETNDKFIESVVEIKNALNEQLAEMENGFGGMESTIDKFIGKLDSVITKYREIAAAAKQAQVEQPAPVPGPVGELISYMPVPTTTPTPVAVQAPTVVNVTVKSDPTESADMQAKAVTKVIQRYTTKGGAIKGLKVAAV